VDCGAGRQIEGVADGGVLVCAGRERIPVYDRVGCGLRVETRVTLRSLALLCFGVATGRLGHKE